MRGITNGQANARIRGATWVFADSRLEDAELIDWALELAEGQSVERDTLQELFQVRAAQVKEPYRQAWCCIFESWDRPKTGNYAERYHLRREMRSGTTQREAIRLIVDAVAPVMKVEQIRLYQALSGEAPPKRPTKLRHLLWAQVTSGERLKPDEIGLAKETRRDFLVELATALNAALLSGLNMARDIGAIDKDIDISTWQVRRVYFVPPDQFAQGGGEPDRHSDGFAPVTKLLSAVIERLAALDAVAARRLVQSWDVDKWILYRRLWAAAARKSELVSGKAIGRFLAELPDKEFWWYGSFPEMAEVRAVRWNDLTEDGRALVEKRLLKGEPKRLLPRRLSADERTIYMANSIRTELLRIKAAGGVVSRVAEQRLVLDAEGEEALPVINVTHGFNPGVRMMSGRQTPGRDYAATSRIDLLTELAAALASDGWDNESQNASEYIAQNASAVLDGLQQQPAPAIAAKIWRAFGYALRPKSTRQGPGNADEADLAAMPVMIRACALIAAERNEVLAGAVHGLSIFVSSWDHLLAAEPAFLEAWSRLWDHAVEATVSDENFDSPLADKAYGSPVGLMAAALTGLFPPVTTHGNLAETAPWDEILGKIAAAPGNAAIAARYVLLRNVAYLNAAAPAWTAQNLLAPLQQPIDHDSATAELWESFAQGWRPIAEITVPMVEHIVSAAVAPDLAVSTRQHLTQVAVNSVLFDQSSGRDETFSVSLVAQILRMGGDAIRGSAVDTLSSYLRQDDLRPSGERFDIAARVFEAIWPKEVTLNAASVSEELVQFAAAAGPRYAEAVKLVLPYLTPFDCWSLLDFRVYDPDDLDKRIKLIDSRDKAAAFLDVLDKSVGDEDRAVIPHDLEDAMKHIARLAPHLERDMRFQRLQTLVRR